eukprot:3702964-Rhodomonas_salina.2
MVETYLVSSFSTRSLTPSVGFQEGMNALLAAAMKGHCNVVQLLIERGANLQHTCSVRSQLLKIKRGERQRGEMQREEERGTRLRIAAGSEVIPDRG